MKRHIALLTALLLAASMVSCGDTTEDKASGKDKTAASVASKSEGENGADSIDKTDGADTSSEDKPDEDGGSRSDDKTDGGDRQPAELSSEGYETILYEYVEAMNSYDIDRAMHIMFPDKVVRYFEYTFESEELDLYDEFKKQSADAHLEITDIIEEGKLSADELEQLMSIYDEMCLSVDLLDTYGYDFDPADLTEEQLEEYLYEYLEKVFSKPDEHSVIITEGYKMTLYGMYNGEPDKSYFYVYYVEGEGWKADSSMRTYVKQSSLKTANANAKTAYNAVFEYLYIDDRSPDDVMLDIDFGEMSRDGLDLSGSAPAEPGAKAVYDLLRDDLKLDEGIVYIGVSEGNERYPFFIQFKDEKNGVIGQYPNMITMDAAESVKYKEFFENQ